MGLSKALSFCTHFLSWKLLPAFPCLLHVPHQFLIIPGMPLAVYILKVRSDAVGGWWVVRDVSDEHVGGWCKIVFSGSVFVSEVSWFWFLF